MTPITIASKFTLTPGRVWVSGVSHARYPVAWHVVVPSARLDLDVTAALDDQELRTEHSTGVTYWEGAIDARGQSNSRTVSGRDWPEWRGRAALGVWTETGVLDEFPGRRAAGQLANAHSCRVRGTGGGRRARVHHRLAAHQGQRRPRARRRDRREDREGPLDPGMADRTTAACHWSTPSGRARRRPSTAIASTCWARWATCWPSTSATGRILWQKDYVKDFNASVPTWGMSGAPLVDGDRLICLVGGEPDGKIIALDKITGEEVWRSLSSDSEPGYNQPIIIEAGGVRQLIIFHADGFGSLDPNTGKVYWELEHRVQMGIVVATPVHSGPYLFFTSQWGGARMLRLDDTKPARHAAVERAGRTGSRDDARDAEHAQFGDQHPRHRGRVRVRPGQRRATPMPRGGDGQARLEDDALLKEHAMYGTAFFVRNGDRYFINNDRGELVDREAVAGGLRGDQPHALIEPTHPYPRRRQLPNVLWSHAAYANRHIVIRNDNEIVRFSLASEPRRLDRSAAGHEADPCSPALSGADDWRPRDAVEATLASRRRRRRSRSTVVLSDLHMGSGATPPVPGIPPRTSDGRRSSPRF